MRAHEWTPDTWDGTSDPEILKQFTCYSKKHRKGKIWLRVYHEPYFLGRKYHFTNSQGANSDDSFSGLLVDNSITLEQAQAAVIAQVQKFER